MLCLSLSTPSIPGLPPQSLLILTPYFMPTTHTHDLSPTLLGSLPTTHTRDFSLPCSHMYQPALSGAKPSHTSVSYWSTLAILKSQWELMDWLPRSCLSLHDSVLLQDMHSACWLLHISFLLALLLFTEDEGYMFLLMSFDF